MEIAQSYPTANGGGWTITINHLTDNSFGTEFFVYAICAKVSA